MLPTPTPDSSLPGTCDRSPSMALEQTTIGSMPEKKNPGDLMTMRLQMQIALKYNLAIGN